MKECPIHKRKVEPHKLTPERKEQLSRVISGFRTYEQHGLGRTGVDKHKIELVQGSTPIKERSYPVSPAVQKLIYAEVDEMFRLGVIEECHSPWRNRSTLVRKAEKIAYV